MIINKALDILKHFEDTETFETMSVLTITEFHDNVETLHSVFLLTIPMIKNFKAISQ